MDFSRLTPGSRLVADQQDRNRRIKDAQEMYQTISRNCERSNSEVPPFEFLELIGKGAFGRVYKCRDRRSGNLVAIKITNIDEQDWSSSLKRDDPYSTIRDFKKEVSILQQLKDSNAENINVIHDAFDLHSQLWIVSDYCTGGSVRTLMRPWQKDGKPCGLPEQYIIPIARELAVALKSMHDIQIIHRDIKCANVYITEEGQIQVGDFGIVGIIEDGSAKRKTVIGTPHWMPQEMVAHFDEGYTDVAYGTEVDIWSYGCTLMEMATGAPPNARVDYRSLADSMKEVPPPRLEDEGYSSELRDLIAMCLVHNPKDRPTADTILKHPAIANTSKKYPTKDLIRLIERFKMWEHGGGSRASLWMAGPTDPMPPPDNEEAGDTASDDADDWNFSTSEDFDRRFSQIPPLSGDMEWLQGPAGAGLPPELPQLDTSNGDIAERIRREHSELSANRGGEYLNRLWNSDDPVGYQVATPSAPTTPDVAAPSDLPLRNFTSDAPTRESMIEIDLDEAGGGTVTSTFQLHMDAINENTIKPAGRNAFDDDADEEDYSYTNDDASTKRATMEWTFPGAQATQPKRGTMDWSFSTAGPAVQEEPDNILKSPFLGVDEDFPDDQTSAATNFEHSASSQEVTSAPSQPRESTLSMIDLDLSLADQFHPLDDATQGRRPSTASSIADSTMTDVTSGNPFDLEDDPVQNELDRNRFSYHKQWQSDGGRMKRSSHKTMPMHARGSSLSDTESDVDHPPSTADPSYARQLDAMHPPSLTFGGSLQDLSFSEDESNPWPNFSSFDGFDMSPQHAASMDDLTRLADYPSPFPPDHGIGTNGMFPRSPDSATEPPGPKVEFPVVESPHPAVLAEDADPQLVESEMSRTLAALDHAFLGVAQAIRQFANIEDVDDDHPVTDTESELESAKEVTEDEDGVYHLTSRRTKPRKLEIRSPPRSVPADGPTG